MVMNWIKRVVAGHTGEHPGLPERAASTPGTPPLVPLIDEDETLVGEFARARRYEQSLTIAVVSLVPLDEGTPELSGSNGNGAHGPNVLPLLAAAGLREALRESDVVCFRPMEGWFVLGLLQSDCHEARQALARVTELFQRRLSIDLVTGVASFPADGLTLEDLENTAIGRANPTGLKTRPTRNGNGRPSRDLPSPRPRTRATDRSSRARSPSETAHEVFGSE